MIHRERTQAHRHPVLVHRSKDGRLATLLGWAASADEAERESTGFDARPPVPLERIFSEKAARS